MKKTAILFIFVMMCVYVRAQTLLSRSYDVSPVISYTVFEPQKDTVYYWQINNVNSLKMVESFYLRFRGRNELQRTLKFLVSLEGEEKGKTYRLDDTIDGNEVTTGKIEGFLFIPSTQGITIENKKGVLPSSAFYTYKSLADVAKGGFDEVKRKKQPKQYLFE